MSGYHVRNYTDQFEIYELVEESTSSTVKICPERGGIAIGFEARGQELFYLDKGTFYDPEANIRGGNPILFPISGQLPNGQYEWEGKTYSMKNHGVARVLPWEVMDGINRGFASVTLRLRSDASTMESFPFEFELEFTYTLKDAVLHIDQQYRNLSDRPMPIYAGFHPYFVADRKNIAYETDATRLYDANDLQEKPFDGTADLTEAVEAYFLLDPKRPEIAFEAVEGQRVRMKYSDIFKYVVLWSVPGKPFVCVEPWMAKTNEMNRKQELIYVEPHETLRAELSISCESGK